MNSNKAITQNANQIVFTINGILSEGLEDVLERIEKDYARTDGDEIEIINPYEQNAIYNVNQFVSQYSAAKNKDFESISLSDMEKILKKGLKHLYFYKCAEEMRDRTEADLDTGAETIITEKWIVYTIIYNGEDYFADTIFKLDQEQRLLAAEYAENLSLFLGDGMLQNLVDWNGSNDLPSLGDVRFTDGGISVVYYNQMDERYAGKP